MLRKLLIPCVLILLVGMTSNASAVVIEIHWTGAVSNNWSNPNNWVSGAIPGADEDPVIDATGSHADPNFTTAVTNAQPFSLVSVGYAGNAGTLYIDSGTITCSCGFVGTKSGAKGGNSLVIMKGGTIIATGKQTVTGVDQCNLGYLQWPRSTVAGAAVLGTFNMSGGLIDVGTMDLPFTDSTGTGIFNLDGGTLSIRATGDPCGPAAGEAGLFIGEARSREAAAGASLDSNSLSRLNITGGKMVISGNHMTLINRYVDTNNVIVAYPSGTGHKYIVRDFDERTDGKTTVTAATYPDANAWKPTPIDDSLFAPQSPTLRWNGGTGATSHDVYFGTSASPGYVATVTTTNDPNYTPAANPLVLGKTYYWKINEIAAGPSTTVGDIWQFTVEGKAKLPSPVNGEAVETKADQLVTLSWTVGKNATGHDVYFGTDNPPATRVSTNQPGNTYPAYPGMGKTYYWKINEISAGPTTTVGNTWSFSTANYRLIDNFESYNNNTLNPNLITGVWAGSALSWDDPSASPIPGWGPHYFGQKSMKFEYSGTGVDTVTATFSTAQNWNATALNTIKALGFHIRGWKDNDSMKTLYVQLKDSGSVVSNKIYYSATGADPDVPVKGESWLEWNMKLTDCNKAPATINMTAIKTMIIGRDSPGVTLAGSLYVDDIRLYPTRTCVSDYESIGKVGAAAADITNDCVVNGTDLYEITSRWLNTDSLIEPDGILMDGATVGNGPTWVASDVNTTGFGNALSFDGANDWVDIDDLALPNFYNKTISFYVKVPVAATGSQSWMLFGTSTEWRANIKVRVVSGIGQQVMAQIGYGKGSSTPLPDPPGITPDEFGNATLAANTWYHIALTLERKGAPDYYVTGNLYTNGAEGPTVYDTGSSDPVPYHYYDHLTGAAIGALNNGLQGWANVIIDDFRIYGTVLSQADITKLADKNDSTNPTATPEIWYKLDAPASSGTNAEQDGSTLAHHAVGYDNVSQSSIIWSSPAELYNGEADGSQKINLKDYSKLAKFWLYGSSGEWTCP